MGCCISFNKKNPHNKNAPFKPPLTPEPEGTTQVNDDRAPPPCLEEETVKEVVLSETPLPKPPTPKYTRMPILQEHKIEAKDFIHKHEEEEETSQVSQLSETYSITESFSTTTATTATVTLSERREDEAVSKVTSYRSPAEVSRKCPSPGGAKSPGKRAENSTVMSRPVPGRTIPRNVRSNGVRRENGEVPSGLLPRSPATMAAGSGMGRRNAGKVTGRESVRLPVESKGKEEINDGVLMGKSELNESLDNPHVSLECFIFL